MTPHFGNFIKRVRTKLGLSQQAFARAIGLESKESVYLMEQKATAKIRADTLESLVSLLGYQTPTDLEAAWQFGGFPDIENIKKRLAERAARDVEGGVVALSPAELAAWIRSLLKDGNGEFRDGVLAYFEPLAAGMVAQLFLSRCLDLMPRSAVTTRRSGPHSGLEELGEGRRNGR